jgi:hypothetical protein
MAVHNLGMVRPGTTLYLPFHTFDSNDPSASVTITGLATTDIEIYKDGNVTQRASDAGYALLDTDGIDFDTTTGVHAISIDLSDNTTANFYEAGSQYWVVINSITVDAATVSFVLAYFQIGYPDAILNTTIASLSSQTSFTLEDGPADNDALNGFRCIVHDLASDVQIAAGVVSDYVGSTKTITLKADPGIFTMAAGDHFSAFVPALTATTAGETLDVASTGEAGVDLGNVTGTLGQANVGWVDANSRVDVGSVLGTAQTAGDIMGSLGEESATAADGDPGTTESVMQYVKQLVNVAMGTTGIVTWPTAAAPDDGVSIAEAIRQIAQDVSGIGASSGGALNFANEADNIDSAIKSVTFVGVETSGTNASVNAEDGTYHQIDDTTNQIDIVYQFDVGGGRSASSLTFKGYLNGANDSMNIQAYNGTGWDTRAILTGQSGSTNLTLDVPLLSTHTGTGSDLGKVFIRIQETGQSNPTLFVDELLVQAVSIGQSVGYSDGAVWIDTSASNTNTESFVDGVADNPVSTVAAARTIADAVGLKRFQLLAGSSITLAQSYDGFAFMGEQWDLALGGQSISDTKIHGATVSGTCTGANPPIFESCIFDAATTVPPSVHRHCFLGNTTITCGSAGDYFFNDCIDRAAGTATPTIDTGSAVANVNVNIHHFAGGVAISNMGQTGTDSLVISGHTRLILNANCTGGTATILGTCDLTDNSATVTVTQTAEVINQVQTVDTVVDAIKLETDKLTLGDAGAGVAGSIIEEIENRATPAQVNTEVVDVMTTDTLTLPGQEAPPATPTFEEAITWLYKVLRNRTTQTSTQWSLLADDESTVDAKATVSDDGTTATVQEIVSGP